MRCVPVDGTGPAPDAAPPRPYRFCGGSCCPVPVTSRAADPVPQSKTMAAPYAAAAGGVNRTTTVWLAPGGRLNAPPETTLNGGPASLEIVPLAVRPPRFVTVNARSADPPTVKIGR